MMRVLRTIVLAGVAGVAGAASAPSAGAQSDRSPAVPVDLAAGAVAQVRSEYFRMDYVTGAADAERLVKRFPASRELAAWRVANLARISRPREAQAGADALLKADSTDAWGWFAQTVVLEYSAESPSAADALHASAEARRRDPRDADAAWVRAMALSGSGDAAQAIAVIDSAATDAPISPALRTVRANAMYNLASKGGKIDKALSDSAFALYAQVRASDPVNAAANTFAASRLLGAGRAAEAYDLARAGVRLSPRSLDAHRWYWLATNGLKDRSQAQRDSEVLGDVDQLVRDQGNEPTVLLAAAEQYDQHRRAERAREFEDRVLAVAPTSLSAEWVLVDRYRAMFKQLYDSTSRDTSAYKRALWSFVNRPTHVSSLLLGDAYRSLYAYTDSTTDADTLLRVVRGMVKYEGINPHIAYAGGAIRLAERGRNFKEAEQMARDGLKAGKARIDQEKDHFETVGDYARAVDRMSAYMYDALGVVYFREGRLDDAQRELAHARDLDPASVNALLHLGELSEKRGRLDDAEQFYMKGALVQSFGANANVAALKRLYAVRHGSVDGYAAYFAGIAETDRANRKVEIANTRIARPAPLQPFQLKTLDGTVMTPDSLRGRVAVINNWGMWCGPCVAEMPEFQKFAAQYASDPSVRVLTIDNDANTDALREWLAKKGYTFTTLIDDGYLGRAGTRAFPTTWFVDADGRVQFEKTGWSEKLGEEFAWRVDMLRRAPAAP